ncbi:hypothetical protein HMPREF1487_09645 [Pseudomonas sp. HPB0071]|uniref:ParA family protein n=1 Tax=Pseudomonas sp. HPB0071 TaxID=1203578 RepID=UPI0002CB3D77|nr:ParA family protein [Pseudomonas sp. HPB0071]ENA26474.1 hypothetical protein HMPREF1487_09645 [Pseudomonas sp. HPB0071]
MALKIAVVSQKGGVGKSTFSRALGAAYAGAEWTTLIADMDIHQTTSRVWHQRRLKADIKPVIDVQTFGSPAQALKLVDSYDVVIFDGGPQATRTTAEIAKAADLVVLPTGLAIDDLEPTTVLANTLADKDGVDPKRIVFALSRTTGSPAEQQAAREYLGYTRFECLAGTIPEKPALRQAQDSGLSIIEARFKGPRDAADEVIQAAILKLESITE